MSMPRVVIDNQQVEVPAGSTILDAARKLGLDIPALCHRNGHPPLTSCMVCLVKVKDEDRVVPSCATCVEEGMQVESESDEVRALRRTGLELLLADHAGDCRAPCQHACPADMDIPSMLRHVAAGRLREAIATVRKDIALPAVLGRVCPELCEKGCRLREIGRPASVCLVKRFVADTDLVAESPYLPPCAPATGRKVAIVGAGPTGLTAAYHLLQAGHSCTVFDDQARPGGMLRTAFDEAQLPRNVLDAEIALIERLGAVLRPNMSVGRDVSLADLRDEFGAVLIVNGRLAADRKTHQTDLPGVFAAGEATRAGKLVVRSVADGKAAACCIDQFLSGAEVTGPPEPFAFHGGRPAADEVRKLAAATGHVEQMPPAGGSMMDLSPEEAEAEAGRCLHCDCGALESCKLRHYAEMYGANPKRFRGQRSALERHLQHPQIVYEPGKCIRCGLCVQITSEAREPLGLTFIGRGFDVRVAVPFDRSIAEGLQLVARRCVEACPTGALVLRPEEAGAPPQEDHDGAADPAPRDR